MPIPDNPNPDPETTDAPDAQRRVSRIPTDEPLLSPEVPPLGRANAEDKKEVPNLGAAEGPAEHEHA